MVYTPHSSKAGLRWSVNKDGLKFSPSRRAGLPCYVCEVGLHQAPVGALRQLSAGQGTIDRVVGNNCGLRHFYRGYISRSGLAVKQVCQYECLSKLRAARCF
jgi:hypothetical protein